MAANADLDELREILRGIDKTDGESDDGWWETSTGAEFGADKLAEVLMWAQRALGLPVIDTHVHDLVDYRYAQVFTPRYRCRCGFAVESLDEAPGLLSKRIAI